MYEGELFFLLYKKAIRRGHYNLAGYAIFTFTIESEHGAVL